MTGQTVGFLVLAFIAGFGLGVHITARIMRAKVATALHRLCDMAEDRH